MLTLDEVRELNAYQLAGHADCLSPDNSTSPGAKLLTDARDELVEAVETWRQDNPDDAWSEMPEALDYFGRFSEIADNAPSIYTHDRWMEFVDLGAYNEDPTELGSDGSDMLAAAGICLYLIAERLVRALASELAEQDQDDDAEQNDDGWRYDSGHATSAEASARFRELADARPEAELRTATSEGGIFEVWIREV